MAAVVGVLQRAIMGRAAALLISGEAGVGKTVLVRAACSQVSDVADVVWGSCLPLTSLAMPFLPLRSALREWAEDHGIPAPVPGVSDEPATGYWPAEFDAWLDAKCLQRPMVFVVDDLHWADQSTLDLLMSSPGGRTDAWRLSP
jgi:predicted ATPase